MRAPRSPETAGGFPVIQGETLRRVAAADNYNSWLLERARAYLGARILDVGAGIGTFTAMLAENHTVMALEPDPTLVPALAGRVGSLPNVTVVASSIGELEEVSSFDSILCLNVLEHIPEDVETLRTFYRLLKPGGTAVLLVPAHPALYGSLDRALHHERRYTRRRLFSILRGCSFEPLEVRYVNPIGAAGWFLTARVLRRSVLAATALRAFDGLVPVVKRLDRLSIPFGLSVWAVARRPL